MQFKCGCFKQTSFLLTVKSKTHINVVQFILFSSCPIYGQYMRELIASVCTSSIYEKCWNCDVQEKKTLHWKCSHFSPTYITIQTENMQHSSVLGTRQIRALPVHISSEMQWITFNLFDFRLFDFYYIFFRVFFFIFPFRVCVCFFLFCLHWELTVNNLSHFEYKINAEHYRITCIWDEQRNSINLLVLKRIDHFKNQFS